MHLSNNLEHEAISSISLQTPELLGHVVHFHVCVRAGEHSEYFIELDETVGNC